MLKFLAQLYFKLTGWRTEGEVPPLKKFVAIAAPHTSGWDFINGVMAKFFWQIKVSYLAKKEVFRFPFNTILRTLGGIPVDRQSHHNLVEQLVKVFDENDSLILAIAPEGTRKYAREWRKGFYYIAIGAKVPIVLCYFDYRRKVVGFGPTFYPTGNYEKDVEEIKKFYRPIPGKYPELGVR